jgi:hypothetical protein
MNPKCRICKTPTETGFNINLDLVPICKDCATAIFAQQAAWYARHTKEIKILVKELNETD